mgnify:CR=1 FL=1
MVQGKIRSDTMKIRRIISVVLCLALLSAMPVFAAEPENTQGISLEEIPDFMLSGHEEEYTQEELNQIEGIFSTWTDDELNGYISYLAENDEQQATTRANVPTGSGQAAWLAAAAIVEGDYPCVAALITSSVYGETYIERVSVTGGDSLGLFQKKIKKTSQYSNYVSQLKAGTAKNGKLFTFESDENADLAYSLHSCTAYYTKTGTGNLAMYDWYLYDIYDFAWDTDYNSPFIYLINNAAYLAQVVGSLQVIDVYIYFSPVTVL